MLPRRRLLDAARATGAGPGQEHLERALRAFAPIAREVWVGGRSRRGRRAAQLVGRLMLALIERGARRSLRSRRVDAQWREALLGLLERYEIVLPVSGTYAELRAFLEAALGETVLSLGGVSFTRQCAEQARVKHVCALMLICGSPCTMRP